ncbi:Plasmodium exported protein, unknown function [Plasmodium berghei]|uniref:Fam-b protein n=1 Tax=Plasmodium berghei TaxID=5821 RepID=A0A1D3L744_PLABE|nr:Plasmodium exported protein, unknown function [Plasmodium berghei]
MNFVFLIKPFIFSLIICYEYYQNDVNKSEHVFKKHNAAITLPSRINRLLAEYGAGPTTNSLSLRRRKKKEFDTESQKKNLEKYINENDIVNLENYIKENTNINNNNMIDNDNANMIDNDNNNMIDNDNSNMIDNDNNMIGEGNNADDNDDYDIESEEEGYSSNYQTYNKRDILTNDYIPKHGSFLGFNKKKMKKYLTDTHIPSGFIGVSTFAIGLPVSQVLNANKFAPAIASNYVLTLTTLSYLVRLIYKAFFNTRKVNI